MARHLKPTPARWTPIRLPLFAETASLVRILLALHEWRIPHGDLALLVRQWCPVGTEGRRLPAPGLHDRRQLFAF
jgi:hypothetical protein